MPRLDDQSTRSVASGDKRRKAKPRKKLSRIGEVLISVLVGVMLVVSILSCLPRSTVKDVVAPVLSPVARATGLDQYWGVFAPNPPRAFSQLEVRVLMSDGDVRVWRPQDDDSMPEIYWRKVKEEVIRRKEFRPALAAWVVRQLTKSGERPMRVVMIADVESMPLPGKGSPKRERKLIFDAKLPPAGPKAAS